MTVGLVQANLASVALESSLYGFFLLLSVISLVGSIKYAEPTIPPSQYKRNTFWMFFSSILRVLKRPIFVGGLLIVMTVTGHWITGIIRLFDAFVYAPVPLAYYADTSHITQLVKNVFLSSSAVIGDALIIYRMWVVWGRAYRIIVFPIISLAGTTAAGIVVAYLFRASTPGTVVFIGSIANWIIVESILSTCTNLYCSIFISWRIWHQMRQTSEFLSVTDRPLAKVLILFVESAALYAIWQLIFLTLLFAHSNIQFTFVDSYPPIAGIAFMSINARIYLSSWSPNTDKSSHFVAGFVASSTGGRPEREEGLVLHPVRPVAVQITVEQENVTPGKNNTQWTQSKPNAMV
ncbi:hypothetical protein PM082_023941 [Marasmius tenuissimus]|nr:hypothetical protein PM082_023941 [Marasmius tenuissimus]